MSNSEIDANLDNLKHYAGELAELSRVLELTLQRDSSGEGFLRLLKQFQDNFKGYNAQRELEALRKVMKTRLMERMKDL